MKFLKIHKLLSTSLVLTALFSYSLMMNALDKQEGCSICLEAFNKGQKTTTLPCGHKFCKKCIDEWKNKYKKSTCPLCRQNIIKNNLDVNRSNNVNDNNNDDNVYGNQYDDIDVLIRESEERLRQWNKYIRNKDEEKNRSRRLNAPTDSDGLTKFEREYYEHEPNCKEKLDVGLQKISRANSKRELNDAYEATFEEIYNFLLNEAPTYELGLNRSHMTDYTINVLLKAKEERWKKIKPLISPATAVATVAIVGYGAIRAYNVSKQKHYENILNKGTDIDTDTDTTVNMNYIGENDNVGEINDIFDLINSNDEEKDNINIIDFTTGDLDVN